MQFQLYVNRFHHRECDRGPISQLLEVHVGQLPSDHAVRWRRQMNSVSLQRLESQENEQESMDLSIEIHGFPWFSYVILQICQAQCSDSMQERRRLEDSPSIQGIFSYLMFLQNKFREGKISETTGPLIQQICFTQYTWVCPKLRRLQNHHFNGKDDDLSWIMRSWWFYWYLATFGHVWYAWWPAWMNAWVPLVWETPVSLHRCFPGGTSQLVVYNPYNPTYIYDMIYVYGCI